LFGEQISAQVEPAIETRGDCRAHAGFIAQARRRTRDAGVRLLELAVEIGRGLQRELR
jgi:hypothetical protein